MEEDFFQALSRRTEFIEILAEGDDRPCQVTSDKLSLLALNFEEQARVFVLGTQHAAHSRNVFEPFLDRQSVQLAIPGGDFQQKRFVAPRARLQVRS